MTIATIRYKLRLQMFLHWIHFGVVLLSFSPYLFSQQSACSTNHPKNSPCCMPIFVSVGGECTRQVKRPCEFAVFSRSASCGRHLADVMCDNSYSHNCENNMTGLSFSYREAKSVSIWLTRDGQSLRGNTAMGTAVATSTQEHSSNSLCLIMSCGSHYLN